MLAAVEVFEWQRAGSAQRPHRPETEPSTVPALVQPRSRPYLPPRAQSSSSDESSLETEPRSSPLPLEDLHGCFESTLAGYSRKPCTLLLSLGEKRFGVVLSQGPWP